MLNRPAFFMGDVLGELSNMKEILKDIGTRLLLNFIVIWFLVAPVIAVVVVYSKYDPQIELMEAELRGLKQVTEAYQQSINILEKELIDTHTELDQTTAHSAVLHQEIDTLQKELTRHKENSVRIASADTATAYTDFELTWYNYNSGYTYTGVPPKDNHTVAVDPAVIPLNTWVIIEMPDGELKKRYTEDIGSAVKGRVIDEYDPASTEELLKRGRTHGVKVYVIGE